MRTSSIFVFGYLIPFILAAILISSALFFRNWVDTTSDQRNTTYNDGVAAKDYLAQNKDRISQAQDVLQALDDSQKGKDYDPINLFTAQLARDQKGLGVVRVAPIVAGGNKPEGVLIEMTGRSSAQLAFLSQLQERFPYMKIQAVSVSVPKPNKEETLDWKYTLTQLVDTK